MSVEQLVLRHPIRGWSRLRPYQRTGALELASGIRSGLWWGCGVGKTATVLAAVNLAAVRYPLLVVTRALGRHVWGRDARLVLGPDYAPAVLWSGTQRGKYGLHRKGSKRGLYTSLPLALSESPIVVTNYEVVASRYEELAAIPWGGMILDEAHAIKGGHKPIAHDADGVAHYTRYHYIKALALQIHKRAGIIWELTATAICDRRIDLWAQLDIVNPGPIMTRDEFDAYSEMIVSRKLNAPKGFEFAPGWVARSGIWKTAYGFGMQYCDGGPGEFGGMDFTGTSNSSELEIRLSETFSRLTRSDVADQLPSIQRDVRVLPAKEIGFSNFGSTFDAAVEEAIDRAAVIKGQDAIELAMQYAEGGSKAIVLVSRRRTAVSYFEKLLVPSVKRSTREVRENGSFGWVTGEVGVTERKLLLDDFNQYNGPGILVATYDCLRESIDLHKVHAAIFASIPWTPLVIDQVEGRFARLGGVPCVFHYLVAEGTIDERIKEVLLDKLKDTVELKTDTADSGAAADLDRCGVSEEEIRKELNSWLSNAEVEMM